MNTATYPSPGAFFLLTFALSSPFWLLGGLFGKQVLPGIPVSALMVLAPLLAAVLLLYRGNKRSGIVDLLKRSFDYQRINVKGWYAPIILLMPGVMFLEYFVLRWLGSPIPSPQFTVMTALILFLALFITALAEELGWMGYAIDPMQDRLGALRASLLLGGAWAVWHFIPLLQVGRSLDWIAWWSLFTIVQRVWIVWLYNNSGQSVFAVALFHAMSNVSWQLFPVNGSFYDPRLTALIFTLIAAMIAVVGSIHQDSQHAGNRRPTAY